MRQMPALKGIDTGGTLPSSQFGDRAASHRRGGQPDEVAAPHLAADGPWLSPMIPSTKFLKRWA
jgi:hypothetical protein